VLHGGAAFTSGGGSGGAAQATSPLAKHLLQAVYDAFYSGLHVCLVLSAVIVALAGLLAVRALRFEAAPVDQVSIEPV
jgi:hypothetical protein